MDHAVRVIEYRRVLVAVAVRAIMFKPLGSILRTAVQYSTESLSPVKIL